DRVENRFAIARRSGYGFYVVRERRDENLVLRSQKIDETPRGVPDEVDPARHALAAVDQQRERRGQRLLIDEVDLLRDAVFEHRKARRRQPRYEPSRFVVNARLEENTADTGFFYDFERLEHDSVARHVPGVVVRLHRDLAALVRILVKP